MAKLCLTSLALLISANLLAADPTPLARQVRTWRAENEKDILEEFCTLLAIPNVASDTSADIYQLPRPAQRSLKHSLACPVSIGNPLGSAQTD